jgi:hypothetical protein
MTHAATPKEIARRRRAFLREWRPRCRAAAGGPEEAGGRLLASARPPPARRTSARTTNAIERSREELERRVEARAAPPSAETAAMLSRGLLASGQVTVREVGGRRTLAEGPAGRTIDLAARPGPVTAPETPPTKANSLRYGTCWCPRTCPRRCTIHASGRRAPTRRRMTTAGIGRSSRSIGCGNSPALTYSRASRMP